MLRSDCILTPRHLDRHLRISIMSRHTQKDGKTPDERITPDLFDWHWPSLAPPPRLVGQWYRQAVTWDQFTFQYQFHLACHPAARASLTELISLALERDVAVLCIEATPELCHRRLLVEYCQRLNHNLAVEIC